MPPYITLQVQSLSVHQVFSSSVLKTDWWDQDYWFYFTDAQTEAWRSEIMSRATLQGHMNQFSSVSAIGVSPPGLGEPCGPHSDTGGCFPLAKERVGLLLGLVFMVQGLWMSCCEQRMLSLESGRMIHRTLGGGLRGKDPGAPQGLRLPIWALWGGVDSMTSDLL